jgi:hypothetical protein
MRKLIRESRYCNLYSDNRRNPNKRGKGKLYYIISIKGIPPDGVREEIRDIVDPLRNIGGKYGGHWSFKDRLVAEKMLCMLLLKYGV